MKPNRQNHSSHVPERTCSQEKTLVPDLPSLATAISNAEPLVSLIQRLHASQQCLEAVKSVIPSSLHDFIHAGPLDEEGWTLLVTNTAVSSKLRQLHPRLLEALVKKGCRVNDLRLRVQVP